MTYEDFVIDEMESHRKEVLNQLSDLIHPVYMEKIIMLLIDGWEHDLADANNLVDEFDLNQKDFAAMKRDLYKFEKILSEELEDDRARAY